MSQADSILLTIWRHGEAGWASADSQRELTEQGRDDIGFACQQFHQACLAREIPHPDLILYSPWLRTTQTADLLGSAFSHAQLVPEQVLLPGSSPEAVVAALQRSLERDSTAVEHMVLVSHQPLVSRLVDLLLGTVGEVPPLPPGGLATLELEVVVAGGALLKFWGTPPQYEMTI